MLSVEDGTRWRGVAVEAGDMDDGSADIDESFWVPLVCLNLDSRLVWAGKPFDGALARLGAVGGLGSVERSWTSLTKLPNKSEVVVELGWFCFAGSSSSSSDKLT